MRDNDDFVVFILLVIVFVSWAFLLIAIFTHPTKVKDSNCIYYNEQIYCLKGE